MTIKNIKTGSTSVKWMAAIYRFPTSNNSAWPSALDFAFDANAGVPDVVIGSNLPEVNAEVAAYAKQIAEFNSTAKKELQKTAPQKGAGIKSISYSRSKTNPASECTIIYKGDLPAYIQAGNWVSIYSFMNNSYGKSNKFTKFCGQIHSVTYDYEISEVGLLSKTFALRIREWSAILDSEIKYDKISLQALAGLTVQQLGQSILNASAGQSNQKDLVKTITEKLFSPLELAQFILRLVGAINKSDTFTSVKGTDVKLPNLALTAPSVPVALMKHMGLTNVQPKNAFSNGFVKLVAGLMTKVSSDANTAGWNGVFKPNGINNYSNDLKKSYEDSEFTPQINAIAALTQLVFSAWNLMGQYCEPNIYEFFTDMWYEEASGGKIKSQPVIVMRDKPFLLKKTITSALPPKFLENPSVSGFTLNDLNNFTIYDYIPRINIPNEYITKISLSNTILNSPNYLSMEFPSVPSKELQDKLTASQGRIRFDAEMNRYGGREMRLQTNFLSAAKTTGNPFKMFDAYKWLAMGWHAFEYRMAEGFIIIKDFNTPISIGMNVRFETNNITLVGHIESYSTDFQMTASGLETTNIRINLSHVVKESAGSLPAPGASQLPLSPLQQAAQAVSSVNPSVSQLATQASNIAATTQFNATGKALEFLAPHELGSLFK